MARRIMLSIIPAVQSPGEAYHSGGFDFKALRAAVSGAKPLIKYGTRAAADEVRHAQIQSVDTYDPRHAAEDIKLTDDRMQIKTLLAQNNYIKCLRLLIEIFGKENLFANEYGGKPWQNICKVLLDLALKDNELDATRKASTSFNRTEGFDYLAAETSIMKEIVVLMNHFDGLAHNTTSIMFNVVEEELKDLQYKNPEVRYDAQIRFQPYVKNDKHTYEEQLADKKLFDKKLKDLKYPREYMKKIEDLMDAKELDNPFDVYRQVKNIIEQSEHRSAFNDYSRRVKEHPQYNENPADVKERYGIIRLKKKFIQIHGRFEMFLPSLLQSSNDMLRNVMLETEHMRNILIELEHDLMDLAGYLYESFDRNGEKFSNAKINELAQKITAVRHTTIDVQKKVSMLRSNHIRGDSRDEHPDEGPFFNVSEVDVNNSAHGLKKEIVGLINMIAEM